MLNKDGRHMLTKHQHVSIDIGKYKHEVSISLKTPRGTVIFNTTQHELVMHLLGTIQPQINTYLVC